MSTQENLSTKLNALNEAFKQSEEYFLIQKIQMQGYMRAVFDAVYICDNCADPEYGR